MTAANSVLAGMDATAALLRGVAPLGAVKPASTSRASTITLANDPDLAIALPQAGTYRVSGLLVYTAGQAVGIQAGFTVTAGSVLWSGTGVNPGTSSTLGTGTGGAQTFGGNGTAVMPVWILGAVTATAAGTLQLQWAQYYSSSGATVLQAGSFIEAVQIA